MVRAFLPQSFVGNLNTNTNFPPEGEIIGAPVPAGAMIYNNGNAMLYNTGKIMIYN